MSLGLTKPGASVTLRHPKTGAMLAPLGYTKAGKAIMPVLGASSDDEDDPAYTGGGSGGGNGRSRVQEDDEDDRDEDQDDDEDDKPSRKPKSKKDDEDEDGDDEPKTRPERQAARYRTRLREAEARERELAERLRAIEDSDKPQDEILKRDLDETRQRADALEDTNRVLTAQLAFFKSNTIDWVDPSDAFALADRAGLFDEVVDEDGNVDTRELQRGLKDLAKRKPHLVKKARGRDEDTDDDDEPRSRSSAPAMNGSRRGKQKTGTDRAALAKRFPVLGRG
jgi:hypothetical protein